MKIIKYIAVLLCAVSSCFLLFNVFFGRNLDWSADFRNLLLDIAYIVLGLSFLLFIIYYWTNRNTKMTIRWFVLLVVTVAAWLLCLT